MLIFKMNRSDEPDISYIYAMKESEAHSLGTYDKIVNSDFTYLCDNGVKYSVSVIRDIPSRCRCIKEGEMEINKENMWVIESITKFGKIMSPKQMTRFYSVRLSGM